MNRRKGWVMSQCLRCGLSQKSIFNICAKEKLGGLRSLAAVAGRELAFFTAPTERTPSRGSVIEPLLLSRCGFSQKSIFSICAKEKLGGLRSLAAVAGRELAPFHGADGADALQRAVAVFQKNQF